MKHHHEPEQLKNHQLEELIELSEIQIQQNSRILRLLCLIAKEDEPPFLNAVKIQFSKGTPMPIGPVTLSTVGQQVTASVVGFDQNGQPWTGAMPTATLVSDDSAQAIVTFDPATGLTTAVANGVANITGSLTTAEGKALSDTETITVAVGGGGSPVLSSIKVNFA